MDEGFGTVVRHKARKRGGGMTTMKFADGKKTVQLRLAGNKAGGTAWLVRKTNLVQAITAAPEDGAGAASGFVQTPTMAAAASDPYSIDYSISYESRPSSEFADRGRRQSYSDAANDLLGRMMGEMSPAMMREIAEDAPEPKPKALTLARRRVSIERNVDPGNDILTQMMAKAVDSPKNWTEAPAPELADDVFSRMAAKAAAAENAWQGGASAAVQPPQPEDDLFSRMAAKAAAAENKWQGSAPMQRTSSYDTAQGDMMARYKAKAELAEQALLSKAAPTSAMKVRTQASIPPGKSSGPPPRKAKKASALKGKKGLRSGNMIQSAPIVDEPEEELSSSEEETEIDYIPKVKSDSEEEDCDNNAGDASSALFDSMFGGMDLPQKDESSEESKQDGVEQELEPVAPPDSLVDTSFADNDSNLSSVERANVIQQRIDANNSPTHSSPPHSPLTSAAEPVKDAHGKDVNLQNLLLEVSMLKYKLERAEKQRDDYQETARNFEDQMGELADEVDELSNLRDVLVAKYEAVKKEGFQLSGDEHHEALGGNEEESIAMATAASGLETEDMWEGSAKFVAFANRFQRFLAKRAAANNVEACVVEFVFPQNVSEKLDGLTEKSFRLSVQNQLGQILSLVCSRLQLASSQSFEVTTMRGFPLSKDRNLASYGLGGLFKRWMLKLELPELPCGTDIAADTLMVQSLLQDQVDRTWVVIMEREVQQKQRKQDEIRDKWKAIERTYALEERFVKLPRDGQQKILTFLMQVEREEEEVVAPTPRSRIATSVGKDRRQGLLAQFFESIPIFKEADTQELVSDLQRHLRLLEYPAGARILHADDAASDMYFVESGGPVNILSGSGYVMLAFLRPSSLYKATQMLDCGRILDTVEPGGHFGEANILFEHEVMNASFEAENHIELFRLRRHDFMTFMMRHPDLHERLATISREMFALLSRKREAHDVSF
jgi:CRP-like cAMP-binding protein